MGGGDGSRIQDRLRRVGEWEEVGSLKSGMTTGTYTAPNQQYEEEDSHNATDVATGII